MYHHPINHKKKANSDVEYSIVSGEPISTDLNFMDKHFGSSPQGGKTLLNKMIGRAFVTIVLPMALTFAVPSLSNATNLTAPPPPAIIMLNPN